MKNTSITSKMNRRCFLGLSMAAATGVLSRTLNCHGQQNKNSSTARNPNIVFILADDLAWADTGYHGSDIETPNLDRLASKAVRFRRHYVMPTCTPTRVGLMTGRYPSRFGVLSPAYGKIFDDDTVTLAAAMRDSGYSTSITGKWHMGSPPEYTPRKYGFDTSYGYFHGQVDPYTHNYKNGQASWHRNDNNINEEGHATDLITNEAVRIIKSRHDKPFFLYVAYSVPHFPLDEPEKWTARYKNQIEKDSRLWYAASVTHMDEGIGRIVEALEQEGLRENTLIVFVSDNGGQKSWSSKTEYKGRYADKPHDVLGDNRPLRGWKGDVYEGGIRVPAFAYWPGVLESRWSDAPVHIVDWMPTLCRLVGYSKSRDLKWDGHDIWPVISDKNTKPEERIFYWKTPSASAVRHGDWKLVANKNSKKIELYNVVLDPYEKRDMANEKPEQLSHLKDLLTKLATDDR